MKVLYVLSILNEIERALSKAKDWVVENNRNPLMWAGFFLFGILVFHMTFSALQKEK